MPRSRLAFPAFGLVGLLLATNANATGYSIIHTFAAPTSHSPTYPPQTPEGALVVDSLGNLYGTTRNGTDNAATLFSVDDAGAYHVLNTFPSDVHASGDLLGDSEGNLYGVTMNGGASSAGSVYRWDAATGFAQIVALAGGSGGGQAYGGLTRDAAGNLYGTTRVGGITSCQAVGCGTIFKVDPAGGLTTLYRFGGADGNDPRTTLLRFGDKLFGTTTGGGPAAGVQFSIKTDGTSYSYQGLSGSYAMDSNLVVARVGSPPSLWGTALFGGDNDLGTIYRIDSSGTHHPEHSFTSAEGGRPLGRIVVDASNTIYGVTQGTGTGTSTSASMNGAIFKYVPGTGTLMILHTFADGSTSGDGRVPGAGLILGATNHLYGTTTLGGQGSPSPNNGVIFRYDL